MANPVGSILRAASREEGRPLNILTTCTHERFEGNLCKTGHNFFAYQHPSVKKWNPTYGPIPNNYTILNQAKEERQLPPDVEFDLVLSQNRFGSYQLLRPIADRLHLPLVGLEHTWPVPTWTETQRRQLRLMNGDFDVFISEVSRDAWGWGQGAVVIHHGIDTEIFTPRIANIQGIQKPYVLSVVNQLRERNWCVGYDIWEETTHNLPRLHVGESSDGWSKPAESVDHLAQLYNEAAVFINTSTFSPIPTVVLERMACGGCVVSTNNCMLPEVITHGVNGFLSNDPKELRSYCELLLKDGSLRQQLGAAARQTILEKFSLLKFVQNWNDLFEVASKLPYRGIR